MRLVDEQAIPGRIQKKTGELFADAVLDSGINCPYCGASQIWRNGLRQTEKGPKQKFKCNVCNGRFSEDTGKKRQIKRAMISYAKNQEVEGCSVRDIADNILRTFHISVSHVAVHKWLKSKKKTVQSFKNADEEYIAFMPLLDELAGKFVCTQVAPYGKVVVIPAKDFQNSWEEQLRKDGHAVYSQSYEGGTAFLVSFDVKDHRKNDPHTKKRQTFEPPILESSKSPPTSMDKHEHVASASIEDDEEKDNVLGCPCVKVEWMDATAFPEFLDIKAAGSISLRRTITVGFIVHTCEDSVTLAMCCSPKDHGAPRDEDLVCELMVIPQATVCRIVKLTEDQPIYKNGQWLDLPKP